MRIEEDLLVSQDVSNDELHDQSRGMEYPDFSDSFVTDVVFPSCKEMVNWVQQVGRGLGMIIVTGRSDLNTSGRTPRIFLECQRPGEYRVHVKKEMKLSTTPNPIDRGDLDYQDEFALFVDHYQNSSADQKKNLLQRLREISCPQNTWLILPQTKVKPKGRPVGSLGKKTKRSTKNESKDEDSTKRDLSAWEISLALIIPTNESVASVQHAPKKRKISSVKKAPKESPKKASQNFVAPKKVVALKKAPKNPIAPISMKEKYLPLVHESFRQYVEDFENVSGDGNCGFRAVAVGMGFDKETGWIQVRQDLVEEIHTWRHDLYDKMWHDDGASKLRTIIDCGIYSFLPLHSSPPSNPKIIGVLCDKDNNHYVNVKLYQNCLFPRPVTSWRDFVFQGGGEWKDWALPRVDAHTGAFRNLQLLTDAGVEPYAIILSDVDDDDDDLM
ncbi:hypothetical protein IFM89_029803 [Coptis chinensis]|uniref:OTU domain-containing protein n=1 Tax=Coptis chinensis TaxID=261450 RepID=A0A835HN67_9MAGN|nr:hypothetical protein IFM89_029803 [Coptis chinensis]